MARYLISAILCFAALANAADRPPNFLVILADDLGAKELGCYGNTNHRTPNLDALAAGGMRFKTCFATPLCTPTRVELMTGRYAFRTGWYSLIGRPYTPAAGTKEHELGEREVTFADVLKARGYATGLAGKWQLPGKVPTLINDCGFNEYRMWAYTENLPPGITPTHAMQRAGGNTSRYWNPCLITNGAYTPTTPSDYGPDLFNAFAIDFLTRRKDEPFVMYCPMVLTHSPHDPTPDPEHPGKKTAQGFKTNVEYMDAKVGELIAALDRLKLRENTIVLFMGDNGTGGDGKGTSTELGVRVPLIVNCPGIVKSNVVSDELVDLSDILPTLAEFAEAKLPDDREIDGHSFAPVLRGDANAKGREWIFSFIATERVLRDKRWLLEGDGKFYDCGDQRDGKGYKDVTKSSDAEVVAARERFDSILKKLPAPPTDPNARRGRRRANRGEEN